MRGLADTLRQAVERHGERAVLLCSFQKEESVLIDELLSVSEGRADSVRIVTIDTGVLFEETLQTWREFEERFGVKVEVQDATDPNGPWTGPEHCCSVAKVAALERALTDADGWITGIRREQGPTRAAAELSNAMRRVGSGSTTRSPTGPTETCGDASTSANSPTTPSTTGAMSRSAAPRAPSPGAAARAAGREPTRRSAACT